MGKEQPVEYYDGVFCKPYNPNIDNIYSRIEEMLEPYLVTEPRILELGCGVGILAERMIRKHKCYHACDFSPVAIQCCKRSSIRPYRYVVADIYDEGLYGDIWDIYIATEVFEHVDDLRVINNIHQGAKVIFSVPVAEDIAHIRTYPNPEFIKEYYKDYLDILSIEEFDRDKGDIRVKYLVVGIKK